VAPAAISVHDELDSTNAEARRRAQAGEAGPVWIAARRQTAGRGRRGRTWSTGEGDLAATLLTTSERPVAEATGVAFVAALSVADLAETFAPGTRATLKWPNDVLLEGRKLAGILVESGPRERGGLWLAVGVGVNLAHAPLDTERPATCLADHGAPPPPSPEAALAALAVRFAHWEHVWAEQGLAAILAAWSERAVGIPGPCSARLPSETVEGHAEGLDADGALRLRLADGSERRISAGDVFFGNG
jgi:BirA family biotin operon repressor/biotin-[acetyl-CoA-carboxylase] ligase